MPAEKEKCCDLCNKTLGIADQHMISLPDGPHLDSICQQCYACICDEIASLAERIKADTK